MVMLENRLKFLEYSKNICYGDEIFILPYHMKAKENFFHDLKKVVVTDILTNGYNRNGCEVEGITYGANEQRTYKGYAIYGYKKGKVITEKGIRNIIYKEGKLELTENPVTKLFCQFNASTDLYVNLPISGDIDVKGKEKSLVDKIIIDRCLLCHDRIELFINRNKIIYFSYPVIYKGILYETKGAMKELWLHMVNNEIPIKQDKFHMEYSKEFLLKKEKFFSVEITV